MIDHITLDVSDLGRSRAFYGAALAPLGYELGHEYSYGAGFASGGTLDFWIRERGPAGAPVHVALRCATRDQVDAFHVAALAAGGTDNGAPGVREKYGPAYYAAFVLDPDGNNVEAVCHAG